MRTKNKAIENRQTIKCVVYNPYKDFQFKHQTMKYKIHKNANKDVLCYFQVRINASSQMHKLVGLSL